MPTTQPTRPTTPGYRGLHIVPIDHHQRVGSCLLAPKYVSFWLLTSLLHPPPASQTVLKQPVPLQSTRGAGSPQNELFHLPVQKADDDDRFSLENIRKILACLLLLQGRTLYDESALFPLLLLLLSLFYFIFLVRFPNPFDFPIGIVGFIDRPIAIPLLLDGCSTPRASNS